MIVGLDSWIICDGNFTDFKKGEVKTFAIEFFLTKHEKSAKKVKECHHLSGNTYKGNVEVVYSQLYTKEYVFRNRQGGKGRRTLIENLIVLDTGEFLAFKEFYNREMYKEGDFIEAEFSIGVDPFFYKEEHSKREGAPNLLSDWTINKIEVDTTPFLKCYKDERFIHYRDPRVTSYEEVQQTNAWGDDICGYYLLDCTKNDLYYRNG